MLRITFLGTGTSQGVPVIACDCAVCRSADPRDRRLRSSIHIDADGTSLVIDTGPEFRLQSLRAGIRSLDLILLTHAHADHIAGLDDIRPLSHDRILPIYGNAATLEEAMQRYSYAFAPLQSGGGLPRFELRPAPAGGIEVGAAPGTRHRLVPVPLLHGILPILGWRIGGFAYLTDCSEIPEPSRRLLEGIEILVIDGLRLAPHETHFSVDQALEAALSLGARETWLTHINHEHGHAELEAYCAAHGHGAGLRPAWDGLVLELPGTGLSGTGMPGAAR
ncbi:MAG TPA: MBL fold metallo-hydrolase [Rectinemataceae bacterium]|nr:MBL fold metallo-hydrolase [Rectinemataceae bacterium]